MKRLLLLGTVMLFASITLFSVVVGNDAEYAYDGGDEGNRSTANPLKILIIEGAGHFIQSNALFQQFLHKIEMAEHYGVNYNELRGILNETLSGIESAKTAYYDFLKLASVTPYNQSFIDALKYFEYENFREKNNLNAVIFSRLEALLISGNVTGVYDEIHARTGEICHLLLTVKSTVDKDIFPEIPLLWEINRVYFDSYLIGQYAAMIFSNIK